MRIGVLAGIIGILLAALFYAYYKDRQVARIALMDVGTQVSTSHSPTDDPVNLGVLSPVSDKEAGDGYTVIFPDGTTFGLTRRPAPGYPFEWDSLSADLAPFKAAAEAGDAGAAFMLATHLKQCDGHAFRTADEVEAEIDRMLETRTYSPTRGQQPGLLFTDNIEQAAALIQSTYEKCKNASEEDRLSWRKWLERSAELGSAKALTELAKSTPNRQESVGYLEDAWLQGNVEALDFLVKIYSDARTSGSGELPFDATTAYAYHLVFTQISEAMIPGNEGWKTEVRNELLNYQSQLQPREVQDGLDLAKSILNSNQNCCVL